MTREEKQRRMLADRVPGLVVRMAIPTIISMLITIFYNMADTFFVGMLASNSATGAVGIAAPMMNLIQALGFFFGQGAGNAISRKLGKGEEETAASLAVCGVLGALVCGVLISVLGVLCLTPICRLLGSTETILPYAKDYLRYILLGAPVMMVSMVLNNQMRFQGCATYAMVGISSGALLNVALDPLFMFTFDLGITGAALATVCSQCVSLCILWAGHRRAGCIRIRLSALKGVPALLAEIAHGGLPSLFRQGLSGISTACLNIAAKPFGDAAIAAMSVVGRIMWFSCATIIGFGQGFQPVCGFNYGAGKIKRVKQAFWFSLATTTGMLLVISALCVGFAEPFISTFRDDAEVVRLGAQTLRIHCTTLPLFSFICLCNMFFQTCKKTLPASLLAAARQGLFFFPTVLILGNVAGLFGIQISQVISDLCAMLMALFLFVRVYRKL